MAQFFRVGARKRHNEAIISASAQEEPPESSPHSGPITGLPDIPELGIATTGSSGSPFAENSPLNWGMLPAESAETAVDPVADRPERLRVSDTDLQVSPVSLGTSVFGWTLSAHESRDVLDRYDELGGNFIDTADSYSAGRSEHLIGAWMRSKRNRDEVVLSTKIGRSADFHGLGASGIGKAIDASLARLQTDHIDLLSFHFDDDEVQLEESLGAVDVLIAAGKVRYLAASNFSAARLLEARVLAANGLPRFRAMQTHYSLLHRSEYESSLALAARAQGLAVMPYFALAHGFLTGNYRSRTAIEDNTRGSRVASHLNRRGTRALAALDRIAEDYSVPLATIAIAWLQAKSSVCAPVVGVSSALQLDDVMAASDFRLSRTDLINLDRATASN